jgi:hypothetical protein
MTDAPAPDGQPTVEHAALAADGAVSDAAAAPPAGPDLATTGLPPIAADRPELVVGAAFAGGLVLALLLKRLAR